jgi:hypothetical protein
VTMSYATEIHKNADFELRLIWKQSDGTPMDLTGMTGRIQFRLEEGAPVLLELTTENGGITLGGTAGTIDLLSRAPTHVNLPSEQEIEGDVLLFNGSATPFFLDIVAMVLPGTTRAGA